MRRDLTQGSVLKNVVLFSLPYLLSYFLQTLYGMADLFIIGQFRGVESTTAVSVGSQVMHMLTVMLVGLAMGATVSIGQAVGGGDHRRASRCIGNTVTLFMGLSVVLTGVLLCITRPIVAVMSTPAEAVEGTVAYLTICFLGIPFITAYNIISSIFRGLGDSKSPMYFIAVACAANIALDYLFMGALDLGPAGAALGTTLAQTVSVAVSLFVILRRDMGVRIQKGDLRPDGAVMKKILKIGIPVTLQDGSGQSGGIAQGSHGPLGLARAALAGAFGAAAAAAVQLMAEPLVALFTDSARADGAQVIEMGGQYLRSYVWDVFFAGVHFSFSGYFCARGKSGLSFLHNCLSIILVRVPGAYLASTLFPDTLFPMGLASAGGSLLSDIVCLICFFWLMGRDKKQSGVLV